MCSPPMIKMTCANLGFAHTSSLPLLYNGWLAVMIVCFWPTWFQISTKRLMTVVSVSLSSAGAWRIGSIPAGVTGGPTVLMASLSAPQGGTDRSSPLLCIRDTIQAITLARALCLSSQQLEPDHSISIVLSPPNEGGGLFPDGKWT